MLRVNNGGPTTTTTYRDRKPLQGIPTLQEFLHRQRVTHLYRDFWRAVGQFPEVADQVPARQQLQREFRMKRTDSLSVAIAIREGDRRLRELRALVGSSSPKNSKSSNHEENPSAPFLGSHVDDSEEVVSKPVGVGWPWERSPNN